VEAPATACGDVIAFLDTGAYQDAAASNFNALARPATVLVTGARSALIKRRETLEEIFARDLPLRRSAM
jgi:diaminopimelate decarboxylase